MMGVLFPYLGFVMEWMIVEMDLMKTKFIAVNAPYDSFKSVF